MWMPCSEAWAGNVDAKKTARSGEADGDDGKTRLVVRLTWKKQI